MKRFKLVFVAALGILGYVGAAASAGVNQTGTVYHKLGANSYQQLEQSERGDGPGQWNCEEILNPPTCTYQAKEGVENPTMDSDFEPSEEGTFVIN